MPILRQPSHLGVARRLAQESCVLLKNDGGAATRPATRALSPSSARWPTPGGDQLGCWAWDGRAEDTVTPLRALREAPLRALPGALRPRPADGAQR